ncbi:MAG: HAD-IA family hydrolase [Pseudomonadota bacterium]
MKNKTFIFDLDGTIVNPGTAIPRCINHALKKHNIKAVPIERLKRYIGFNLEEVLGQFTGKKDKKLIKSCIDTYRERYHKEGIAEHRLYPGIVGLLEAVSENGNMIVASIKPQVSCEMVMNHLGISSLFTAVYGAELNGRPKDKGDLLKKAIKKEGLKDCIAIGDRSVDIEAAKKCGIPSIGVAYGYGTKEELVQAGADMVAETVGELRQCLLNHKF